MKRFLSIFLALTMILAMMPTTFAAVDAKTGVVTYNFYVDGHTDLTPNLSTSKKTVILEDRSGNKYFTDYGTDRDWAYIGTNAKNGPADYAFIDLFGYHRTASEDQNTWVAYKIRVPETATYKVDGTMIINRSNTNALDIYIAPLTGEIASTFSNTETYGTVSENTRTDAKSFTELSLDAYKLGRVFNQAASSVDNGKESPFVVTQKGNSTGTELLSVELKENTDYVLVFNQAAEGNKIIAPKSVILTPEIVTVEPTITVSADKAEIFTGDTATLSAAVTDSTGEKVSSPTVTYTTEDTDIVSVNAETGVVTGLKEGTATITATYVENGKTYEDTATIKVKSSTVTYKFYSAYGTGNEDAPSDIGDGRIVTVEALDGTKGFGDYAPDRPWAYLGASSATPSHDKYYIHIFDGRLNTASVEKDNWIAFKIKVPKTASYSISGSAYKSSSGTTMLEMYIAPLTGTIEKTFETASIYSTVAEGVRSAGKLFDDLGISEYHVGTTNINEKVNPGKAEMQITDAENVILSADTDYVLVFNQGYGGESGARSITPRSITLTPSSDTPAEEDITALENAFDATATATAFAPSITATAYTKDTGTVLKNAVNEVSNGDGTYTLTAGEIENYKFLYWAKGLTTERTIVSFIPEIQSYKPTNGNNILIAVYESTTGATDTAKAEFYNANRQLLGTITDTDEGKITLPYLPSMAGYTDATHWELYGDTEKTYQPGDEVELTGTMLFVAQYDDGPTEVTVNGDPVPYGTLCEFEAEEGRTIKWWTKTVNGKTEIVSLSDKYSFCAWENCEVAPVYAEAKFVGNTMKIVLARLGTDAVMAEFIGFDSASVAEKGIILGTTNIAMKTANTQFVYTGLGSATEACGYAIIKNADGTTYTKILDGEITLGE